MCDTKIWFDFWDTALKELTGTVHVNPVTTFCVAVISYIYEKSIRSYKRKYRFVG